MPASRKKQLWSPELLAVPEKGVAMVLAADDLAALIFKNYLASAHTEACYQRASIFIIFTKNYMCFAAN